MLPVYTFDWIWARPSRAYSLQASLTLIIQPFLGVHHG
jgi:hypothetical protein